MVEQEAVNFEVTGSSPVRGAKILPLAKLEAIFFMAKNVYSFLSVINITS